ncbi:MAG: WapI family immunity protein [Lawsonibacter sp.]
MSAIFLAGNNQLEIFDFQCDDWESIHPYNTSFKIRIRSTGEGFCSRSQEEFSCLSSWECDSKAFRTFVEQLQQMYYFETNLVEFKDIAYGGNLCFELDRMGHIRISGLLFGNHGDQHLAFAFNGDQTCLIPFLDGLKAFLKG